MDDHGALAASIEAEARKLLGSRKANRNGNGAAPTAPTIDGLPLTQVGALLAEPEEAIRWLLDEHLPMGGMSLLVGKPKAGKSTAARCLALAVARGEAFLGFRTERGPVLYLAFEEKKSEVRRHFGQLGVRAGGPDPVHCCFAVGLDDALVRLAASVQKIQPVLVIVDPLFRLMPGVDGNDYSSMMTALAPLLALARESGAHLCTPHHGSKAERSGGDEVLGSTAIFGTVDTLLTIKRYADYRTIRSVQRYGVDLEETTLALDLGTGAVGLGLTRDLAERQAIGESLLAEATTPEREDDLLERVEGRLQVKRRALRDLVEGGQMLRTGAGRRGEPYLYQASGTRYEKRATPSVDDTYSRSGPRERETENPEFRERETGGEGRACPKGHPMQHGVGLPPDHGWVCPVCYPAAGEALGVAS